MPLELDSSDPVSICFCQSSRPVPFYSVKLPRLMKTPGACVLNDNRIDFHDGTIYDVKAAMWYELPWLGAKVI